MNILITGTSSGIGFGLSKYLLDKGHNVYGISRSSNASLFTYVNYRHLYLDLSDAQKIKSELLGLITNVTRIDLVFLNAGILGELADMKDTSIDRIKHIMDTNVWANKNVLDEIFKWEVSIKQVVAVSSGASVSGSRGWNAYSISKAALNMLIKLYAAENPSTHFTSFAPGLVDTNMQDYIYQLKHDTRFPTVERLKEARYTDLMPNAEDFAPLLFKSICKLHMYPSGDFIDIRDIELD